MDAFRNQNIIGHCIDYVKFGYPILLSGVLICLSLIYFYSGRKQNLPPGPYGVPFLGYFPFLGEKPYETFSSLSKTYGKVFSLNLGAHLVVILNDGKCIKEAFIKAETVNRSANFFDFIPNGFGQGGLNGADWVEQKRFSLKVMNDIGTTLWMKLVQEDLKDVVERMKKHGTAPVDVRKFFSSTFMDIVLTAMFGHRLPHLDIERVSHCADAVADSLPVLGLNVFLPKLSNFLTTLGLTRQSSNFGKFLEFTNFVTKAIEKRKEQIKDNDENFAVIDEYIKEMRRNEKKKNETSFTERHLQGNAQDLLLGGSEASRAILIFLLISMAEHQEVQKRVQEELDNVLDEEGILQLEDMTGTAYTQAAVLEAMRWRSIMPINDLKMAKEDIKISGYDIPKGTLIVANNWALQNDPKYWKNPEKFIPERFLDDEKKLNVDPDSFVLFPFGECSCPSEVVAMGISFHYFVTLIQKFTVIPEEGEKVKYGTVLGFTFQATGVKLKFISRE